MTHNFHKHLNDNGNLFRPDGDSGSGSDGDALQFGLASMARETSHPLAKQFNESYAESTIRLAQKLVKMRSETRHSHMKEIVNFCGDWLVNQGLIAHSLVGASGQPLGVWCSAGDTHPAKCRLALMACIDTAPIGDKGQWSFPPHVGDIQRREDGSLWLRGRGAADSKVGAAVFMQLMKIINSQSRVRPHLKGVSLLLDADEHSGDFRAIQSFSKLHPSLRYAMIGYPGDEEVVVGARGFARFRFYVHGEAAHSGSSRPAEANASVRAGKLIAALDALELPRGDTALISDSAANAFAHLRPKITVTHVSTSPKQTFTIVPSTAKVLVDVRMTPDMNTDMVKAALRRVVKECDREYPNHPPTEIKPAESYSPYVLDPDSSLLVQHLAGSITDESDRAPILRVCGPSNVGNMLFPDVEATAGFGVPSENVHGFDEAANVSRIPFIAQCYLAAIDSLTQELTMR